MSTLHELALGWNAFNPIDAFETAIACEMAAAFDLSPPAPSPLDLGPQLPLGEWLAAETAYYRQSEQEGSELIALTLGRLAHSARYFRCQTVAQLLAADAWLSHATIDAAAIGALLELDFGTMLGSIVACEAQGYLLRGGPAALLVAWAIADLAHEIDYHHATVEHEFLEARREAEKIANEAAGIPDDYFEYMTFELAARLSQEG